MLTILKVTLKNIDVTFRVINTATNTAYIHTITNGTYDNLVTGQNCEYCCH
jgi:hypothetical protein